MHDIALPGTANFTGPTRAVGKLDNASSARLRYDSFQLLSSATVHDVSRLKPNL
jgi:hypothetical protein